MIPFNNGFHPSWTDRNYNLHVNQKRYKKKNTASWTMEIPWYWTYLFYRAQIPTINNFDQCTKPDRKYQSTFRLQFKNHRNNSDAEGHFIKPLSSKESRTTNNWNRIRIMQNLLNISYFKKHPKPTLAISSVFSKCTWEKGPPKPNHNRRPLSYSYPFRPSHFMVRIYQLPYRKYDAF